MYHITKHINGRLLYETKVVSLIAKDEHMWYAMVWCSELPTMREINEYVQFHKKYSFVSGKGSIYAPSGAAPSRTWCAVDNSRIHVNITTIEPNKEESEN